MDSHPWRDTWIGWMPNPLLGRGCPRVARQHRDTCGARAMEGEEWRWRSTRNGACALCVPVCAYSVGMDSLLVRERKGREEQDEGKGMKKKSKMNRRT